MANIKNYKDLRIWRLGIDIVKETYAITKAFPREETFTLCSQMQRAAISIPSNIAEGQPRGHTKEFIQFLRIALSSCAELETQAIIANELGYLKEEPFSDYTEHINALSKQIQALLTKLNKLTTNH